VLRTSPWLALAALVGLMLASACGQRVDADHHAAARAGFPCVECHRPDYDAALDPNHAAGGYPTTCQQCHTLEAWAPATFAGHDAFWPLTGAHAAAQCESCHAGGVYEGTATACESCHGADYDATTKPSHAAAGLPRACEVCHDTAGWVPSRFDHDAAWPLTGAHVAAACESCHADGFEGTARECVGCHLPDWQTAADPDHVALELPQACVACHGTAAWKPADFEGHDAIWPLVGEHREAACESCHKDGYAGTPTACDDCHHPDYVAAKTPDHVAAGYPTTCESCHAATGWKPSTFDHEASWPLTGAHAEAACESCHEGGVYAGTPDTCVGCHQADYEATADPDHEKLGLPTTCSACHGTATWAPADFDGHDDYWPLVGKHVDATCESCHFDGYAGTTTVCDDCHHPAFLAAAKPDHVASGFPTTCATCHSAEGWVPSGFDHEASWPLTGAHAVAACASCHEGGVYAGTATECAGCHQDDFDGTVDPDHGALKLPTTCVVCHGTAAWEPAEFGGHDAIWPIEGKHVGLACESCHADGYTDTPATCVGCHQPDYLAAKTPEHAAAGYPTTCETCHAETGWAPSTFNHDAHWPLTGQHVSQTCASCHAGGVFAGTATECAGCHQDDYDGTVDPDHGALKLPTTCVACHGTAAWEPAEFGGHDAIWPIEGKHVGLACESCHADGYTDTPATCVGCHQPDYLAAKTPEHAAAGYPTTCETCHAETGWAPSTFNHDAHWPLTGQHVSQTCASCHAGGVFAGTATECAGCHQDDYDGTVEPDHGALKLPNTCEKCHATAGWAPASFDDHATVWPLLGKHAAASCESCHAAGYAGTPTACNGCHQPDYVAAAAPEHKLAGYPTTCETCHAETGWKPSTFNHATKWPLLGDHAVATCASCHAGAVFAGTPKACVGCHQDDYDGAVDPDHVALAMPKTCEVCHDNTDWSPADFSGHDTLWPLLGKHAAASCESCHAAGYAGTPTACNGCHEADYVAAKAPEHKLAGYPTTCETCHAETGWKPSPFDHATKWPLLGDHAVATCASCHAGAVFAGTPKACVGCHQDDYDGTIDPDHVALAMPKTCEVCHDNTDWAPANFTGHDSLWPLLGKHAAASCESCHAAGYAGTPTACNGCHQPDYAAAKAPEHKLAGYPTTCETCHAETGWKPSPFDHATKWALTGKHAVATCASCHAGGVFAGTPKACVGCHQTDYNGVSDPNHKTLKFATTCESCHATSGWSPATFPGHDALWPLLGKHTAASCESCHAAGYAGTPTACNGCHQPDYVAAKAPEHKLAGYPTTCETCHAETGWKPSTFNHATKWPLLGDHAVATCESCHAGGVYAGTPKACVGCHQDDYNGTIDPDHIDLGFPKTCDVCHGNTDWAPANFSGHDTLWPLLGKHATASCESCHAAGYVGTSTACDSCHHDAYVATTAPKHSDAGFPTTCETCHAETGWKPATFDHDDFFVLTGAHTGAACESCHAGGVYAGTPTTCNGCHASDYAATTSPSHTYWTLSSACETCHTTTTWDGATFTSTVHNKKFPISGNTNHKIFACKDCHKTPSYADWICVTCHTGEHTLAKMNSKHTGDVPKYPSTMAAAATPDLGCKSCHPKGND
jgi:hypothetical protein